MQYTTPALGMLVLALTGFAQAAAAPTAVIVEEVSVQRIADPLEALGTLKANETVRITANVSDTVSRIHFEDGQTVAEGEVLLELTDAEEHALLTEAQALATEAQRQYERLVKLVAEGTAAESLLDERRREAETAAARLAAVESRLQDRIVVAPFAGVVGLRNVSVGARLEPGDVITTLVDNREMKLDFTVPSVYLPSVGRGTAIRAATPVYPDRTFTGTVASIDSTIDPDTRSITVRARLPNADGALVPGMLMTVNLFRAERDALVISEAAIVPSGSTAYVWRVDATVTPPVAERRQVELGARQPGTVEVIRGLAAGDLVVTHGTLKVRPGAPLVIKAIDDGSSTVAEMLQDDAPAANGG